MKFEIILITFLAIIATYSTAQAAVNLTDYENNIIFYTFNTNGQSMNWTLNNTDSFAQMCNSSLNWTMVSHAWREKWKSQPYMESLVQSFLGARGGCVIFMDYGVYSFLGYSYMVTFFEGLFTTVVKRLQKLNELGFAMENGFLFSFGFSSHLWFTSAYNYTNCTIGRIDACNPTKPQYLNNSAPVQAARFAAKIVNCFHTSDGYGTNLRYCQKNVNWGRCGKWQPAYLNTKLTHHQLCPYFYNNSFVYDYDIVPKSTSEIYYKTRCFNQTVSPLLMKNEAIHSGFRQKTCIPNGEYFALTSNVYPYNVPSNYSA